MSVKSPSKPAPFRKESELKTSTTTIPREREKTWNLPLSTSEGNSTTTWPLRYLLGNNISQVPVRASSIWKESTLKTSTTTIPRQREVFHYVYLDPISVELALEHYLNTAIASHLIPAILFKHRKACLQITYHLLCCKSRLNTSMVDPISLTLTPVLNYVIKKALDLVSEEIILLAGLHDAIDGLSRVLKGIKHVLNDAEKKQTSSQALVDWLKELWDAAYDAEDALELFASKVHLSKQKIMVLEWFKIKAAHTIKELSERFDRIDNDKHKFNLQIDLADPERNIIVDRESTAYFLNKSEVVGREIDKEAIIKALVTKSSYSDDFDVISIIGIGGTGKTTLAQLVFDDPRINDHYGIYKMWICVNVNFDLDRILREMIKYHSKMANDDLNLSRSQLQSRVVEFLTNNRFLLVLDDVWTQNAKDWDSLKGLLNLGASGSRVLVTCRNISVTTMMSTGPEPYRLSDLKEEESWQLFSANAFINGQNTRGLEDIGRKIIGKCNGLPLAIKAVAGLLRGELDVKKWNRILEHEIWELEEQDCQKKNLKVLPALKLSFDHLPSYLKPCFLFCSIFPKAHSFVKSELVKIWMAEGFILLRGREKPEDTGDSYFDELLGRSFFQFSDVSRDKTYRMHDLIHDLALSISGPHSYHVITKTTGETDKNSRHVSMLCENVEKPASNLITKSTKVRTLLLRGGNLRDFGPILDKLFHSLKYIRVLDLSSSSIDAIPNSIQELQLLRYLDLSKTDIKKLPNSICNLWKLQTLRLLRCLWLHELPEGLAKLTSLRHLEVDDIFWHKLSRLPAGVGSLRNLHNLQKFWVAPEKGNGVEQLQDMMSLTGTLHLLRLEKVENARNAELEKKKNLVKVVFQWTKTDDGASHNEEIQERTLLELQPHPEVEELRIIHFCGRRLPTWFTNGSLQKLTRVSLNHCNNLETLSLGQLPHLTWLYLKGMSKLEECPESEWASLKLLKVSGCPKLRSLPVSLYQLNILKIKGCDSLKVLPVTACLRFLTLVDNAILEDWKEVGLFTVQDDQGNQRIYHQHSLANLLDVKIIRCPMLKQLPNYFRPRKLDISECDQLKGLPPLRYSEHLKHLSLDTSNDGTLLSLIPDCPSLDTLMISNISILPSLPKLPSLPGVKALYIRGWVDLEHLWEEDANNNLQCLVSLQFLSIQNCPKLKSLPSSGLPTTLQTISIGTCPSLRNLGTDEMLPTITSLTDIYIQNCKSLERLPEDGFPESLRHLKIHGCPMIAERGRQVDGPDWSKISHVPDLDTDFDKMASSSGSASSVQIQARASSSKSWFRPRLSGCTSQYKDVVKRMGRK